MPDLERRCALGAGVDGCLGTFFFVSGRIFLKNRKKLEKTY